MFIPASPDSSIGVLPAFLDASRVRPEDRGGAKEMGAEKATKAPEGATAGGTAGGIIGGCLGLLVGIGALAIPGLGPFIAAGPIMAGLAGLGGGRRSWRCHRRFDWHGNSRV
jgi:hypothetical protein